MGQHFSLAGRGYGELAKNVKLIATDAMRHAEILGKRIKERGGNSAYDQKNPVAKNQSTDVLCPFSACLEKDTIGSCNACKKVCVAHVTGRAAQSFATAALPHANKGESA